MTTPIDLSKYAKGRRLKCVRGVLGLTEGREYESRGTNCEGRYVEVTDNNGVVQDGWDVSRFVPVEDEAPEFKAGDRVRVVKRPHDSWCAEMPVGRVFAIGRLQGAAAYDEGGHHYIMLDCIELIAAPPVAASPKVEPTWRGMDPASDASQEFKDNCQRFNDAQARILTDMLPANEAARLRNVAALKAEMGRKPIDPRFPPEGRACRVYRSNDR